MSAGYAARLSEYPNKGVVGLPEQLDTKRQQTFKKAKLAEWVRNAKHLVVLTGAGISTSAGIPDFRGPKGIWTLEKQQQIELSRKRKRSSNLDTKDTASTPPIKNEGQESHSKDNALPCMDFGKAQPTLTHRAITKLVQEGIVQYCVTQNVDGLHKRAGLSRQHHASVHGCAFTEVCRTCGAEYFRDEDVGGMSFQKTGRYCDDPSCQGPLYDTLLDWEDPLPEEDFAVCEDHCTKADLVLCLGTSLRIEPAGSLPLLAKRRRFVIVNLQVTPKDDQAALIIRAPVDQVMSDLLVDLGFVGWQDKPHPQIERKWKPNQPLVKKSQDEEESAGRV